MLQEEWLAGSLHVLHVCLEQVAWYTMRSDENELTTQDDVDSISCHLNVVIKVGCATTS